MQEKLSTQYNEAVQQIKTAILRSQAKALAGVNQEQLALYYGIDDVDFRRDSAKLMRASLCSRCSGRWALHLEELPWRINLRFSSFAPRKSLSRAQLFTRLGVGSGGRTRLRPSVASSVPSCPGSRVSLPVTCAICARWLLPSSVATRHNPNEFGFCSRCSIGSMRNGACSTAIIPPSSPRSRPRRNVTSTSSSVTTAL